MKVLQINTVVGIGSTGRIADSIGDFIIKNNSKSYIGYGRKVGKSNSEFKLKQVWDSEHPEHQLFKNEFNKIWKNQNLFHNLYEFIDTTHTSLI